MSEAGLEKFTADNPWIFDLISYFDGETQQIPWESTSLTGDYTRYMLPTYNAASQAVASLNLDRMPTSSEATQATKELFEKTKSTWGKISSMGTIAWESALGGMPVVYEVLATFSASAFFELKLGFDLHASGVALGYLRDTELRVGQALQRGDISEQAAVKIVHDTQIALQKHASMIQEGLGAISYLDKKGWFSTQQQKTSGLGLPPLAIVLGLAAIAAAALVIVSVYQISTVNNLIKTECTKFQDEKLKLACISELSKSFPKIDFAEITGQIAKWLTFGLLVAGAVFFLPTVTRSLLGARKELKEAE